MKIRALFLLLVPVLIVVPAACGSSDESSDDTGGTEAIATTVAVEDNEGDSGGSAETTAPADSADAGDAGQAEVGEAGSFTVNGSEFAATFLNRCIPFQDEPGNIDLQAIAQGNGAKLNLYVAGTFVEVSVDGSGIEDMFGSIAFGQDPVVHESTIEGDRWKGSATVGDSLGSGDTVDIAWDVMIPPEAIDCSL